jgi:hypothetical protein
MKLHTLTKIRRATKHSDGAEGILYIHQWPTGFQELIFETEALAQQFLGKLNEDGVQENGNAQPLSA